MRTLEDFLKEAAIEGIITCPSCGSLLEPDCPECGGCGWENPLVTEGLI